MIALTDDTHPDHDPWNGEHLRWHIARCAAQLVGARQAAAPPGEAEVCDALDRHVERGLRAAAADPEVLATALIVLEAVDAVRAARGHVVPSLIEPGAAAAQVAAAVVREVVAEVVRRPSLAWAHDLRAQILAREAAARRPATDGGPPRPRAFVALAADYARRSRPATLLAELALALRDAEAQAVVDLRQLPAGSLDVEAALRQLAAISRTRAELGLDRPRALALVRQRRPAC